MNQNQILGSAVLRSLAGGWDGGSAVGDFVVASGGTYSDRVALGKFRAGKLGSAYSIVFNHGFCKGLWGDDWQFHLSEMVLREEPLMYIWNWMEESAGDEVSE